MTRLTWLSSSQALPQMSLHPWAWLRQWLLSSPLTSSRSHTVSHLFHVLLNWDWDSGHWGRAGPHRSHHSRLGELDFSRKKNLCLSRASCKYVTKVSGLMKPAFVLSHGDQFCTIFLPSGFERQFPNTGMGVSGFSSAHGSNLLLILFLN